MNHTCLEQVDDDEVIDYPAHKYIKHAGEAFKNELEHEDHYLLSIGFTKGSHQGGLVVIKISLLKV